MNIACRVHFLYDREKKYRENKRKIFSLYRKVKFLNKQYVKLRGLRNSATKFPIEGMYSLQKGIEEITPQLEALYQELIIKLVDYDDAFRMEKLYINNVSAINGKLKRIDKILKQITYSSLRNIWGNNTVRMIVHVVLLIVAYLSCASYRSILPYVRSDEYVEENKNDIVIMHNKSCPIYQTHWFTTKNAKYELIIKKNAAFCLECFDRGEIEMLKIIHLYNLLRFETNLQINGASKEYIRNKVKNNYKNQHEIDKL